MLAFKIKPMVWRNLTRHLCVFFISCVLLVFLVMHINRSYYTTISKVNDVEITEIFSILSLCLLNNCTSDETQLEKAIQSAKFLKIDILSGGKLVIQKNISLRDFDPFSRQSFDVGNFRIDFYKRKYPTYVDDYFFYFMSLGLILTGNNPFKHSLFETIFTSHLALLFFLELIYTTISAKYRIKLLSKERKNGIYF